MKIFRGILSLFVLIVFFLGINHEFSFDVDSHEESHCPVCQIIHSGIICLNLPELSDFFVNDASSETLILLKSNYYNPPKFNTSHKRAPPYGIY